MELWGEDEARLGLKPILRRVWSVKGSRPTASGRTVCEWLYPFGFVHPATGRNPGLIIPRADTRWMNAALAEFAAWADPDQVKTIVLLVDNAGWHVAGDLAQPPGLVLHHLPPCTPELQPAEAPWPLVREFVANKGFAGLEEITPVLVD